MALVAAAAEGTRRVAGAPRPPCKHFLHIDDWSRGGVSSLLKRASEVRECLRTDGSFKPLSGRSLAMIFTKPSARTRVSFETVRAWLPSLSIFFTYRSLKAPLIKVTGSFCIPPMLLLLFLFHFIFHMHVMLSSP